MKLDIFGEIVVTLGTVPQGQGHETTASQVVADILGCSPDQVHVRPGHDTLLQLARRLLGDVREPVRRHRARRRQGRGRCAAGRDDHARGRRPAGAGRGDRARRRVRPDQGRPARGGAAVHGARRDREREQRLPAARLQPDAEPPLRLPAVLRHGRHGEEDREADADLRDADPRVRGRGRSRDGRRRDRRLRRRRRLRHPDPPADRRGPGARCDGARDRRRALRGLRLRRGRAAPDLELLRLPRAARARRAVAEDRRDRVAVPVLAARLEGDGRGRRRRDPLHRLGDPGRAAGRSGAPIVYDSCNPYHRVWSMLQDPESTRANVSVVPA